MAKKYKIPAGAVLMRHADAAASCTVDGVSYEAADGVAIVPVGAVEALRSHGFTPDGEDVEQAEAPEAAAESPAEAEPEAAPEAEPPIEAEATAEA